MIEDLHVYVLFFFFFFKQKTAYEVEYGLVGSEMCIRDRGQADLPDTVSLDDDHLIAAVIVPVAVEEPACLDDSDAPGRVVGPNGNGNNHHQCNRQSRDRHGPALTSENAGRLRSCLFSTSDAVDDLLC